MNTCIDLVKPHILETQLVLPQALKEAAIALLADVHYYGFEETEEGVNAYIESARFDPMALAAVVELLGVDQVQHHSQPIPPKDWNEAWEANYPSVSVEDFCQIIPSFRKPQSGFSHTLVIDPKMAFGTGNHETTRLMIRLMAACEFRDTQVLDMGCGTGVLAILAEKLGAQAVWALDIDPWSEENARENAHINGCTRIEVRQGNVQAIPDQAFDLVLANINRNVLLADLPQYQAHLRPGATLLLSGVFTRDRSLMLDRALALGFKLIEEMTEGDWLALRLCNDIKLQ